MGFLPHWMGPYLLLLGWHATWVGVSELAYLVTAWLMAREKRGARMRGGPEEARHRATPGQSDCFVALSSTWW